MQILIEGDIEALPQAVRDFVRKLLPPPPTILVSDPAREAARFVVAPVRSRDPGACGPLDLDDQPEPLSAALDSIGIALLHRGCPTEAAPFIERALELRRRLFGDDHPTTAISWVSRARLHRLSGSLADAEADAQRGLAIHSRVYGGDGYPIVADLVELGAIQLHRGAFTAAEQSARHGLAILERLRLEQRDPDATRLKDILGHVLQTRGDYQKATSIYNEILASDRNQVGEHHFKFATHLASFATVKLGQNNLKGAADDLTMAIDILRKDVHRPRHPNLIDMLTVLGSVQLRQGSRDKARATLNEALELNKQVRGPESAFVGTTYVRLGRVEHDARNFSAADRNFDLALNVFSKVLPSTHQFIAEAKTWKARALIESPALADRQRPDRETLATVKRLLSEALEIWEIEFGECSVEHAIANALLGHALLLENPTSQRARDLQRKSQPIIIAARGADSPIAQLVAQG